MRISVTEMYDAHELLKQFAAARTAEGVNHVVSQEAMVVYRHFSKNSQNGMSVEQWREFVDWYVTNSSETKKYTELIFYTHVAPLKGEPAWVEEGCRRGKVAPIGDDDWDSEVKGLTFPRFMVAFSELSFRAEAREGHAERASAARVPSRHAATRDHPGECVRRRREGEGDQTVRSESPEHVGVVHFLGWGGGGGEHGLRRVVGPSPQAAAGAEEDGRRLSIPRARARDRAPRARDRAARVRVRRRVARSV